MEEYINESPQLIGERVLIRLPDKKDISAILDYFQENKVHLEPFEPIKQEEYYTEAYWERDIEKRQEGFKNVQSVRMFIFEKNEPSKVIGVININNIVRGVFQACYLGYSIAENRQGKGYMRESLELVIDYAFHKLKLHRLMANYLPTNERSGKLLRRMGFTVEGYARDYLCINGKWEDHVLTSLTNHDREIKHG